MITLFDEEEINTPEQHVDLDIQEAHNIETDVDAPKKRKRRSKKDLSQADIDADVTNPNSIIYVDKEVLHRDVVEWQNKVNSHNAQYNDVIMSFISVDMKNLKDDRARQKKFDEAVREAVKSKAIPQEPRMPDTIGLALLNICEGLSKRFNFRNYTYRDEMVRDAVVDCVKAVKKYDGEKFTNPFGYFSQIATYAFLGRLDKEKKAHKTKMDMAFDPATETYSRMEGDEHEITTDDIRGFYYEGK